MRTWIVARFALSVVLVLASVPAWAEQIIDTVAGGGPDNVPAISANVDFPWAVAMDMHGNLFIAADQAQRVFKVDAAGLLTVLAGNGFFGFSGDGGPAAEATLKGPKGVGFDAAGNVYIADTGNHRIRRVDAATGVISTVVGNGQLGFSGDGGLAINARLSYPYGMTVDAAGNLFFSDARNFFGVEDGNHRIRRVDATTGIISTVAGFGVGGGFNGDGDLATRSMLFDPIDVAVDAAGNLFIVDVTNQRIRRVDITTGIISTVAGTGVRGFSGDGGPATSARLRSPASVALDVAGNLFIADSANQRIRRVDAATGVISTVAGDGSRSSHGDGGPATSAGLWDPLGVAVDTAGNLLIADTTNQRIRRVDAVTGVISTVAGTGVFGFGGDGFAATSAGILQPLAVAVDTAGNLFITHSLSNRVRRVDAATGVISTVAGGGVEEPGDGGPATSARLSGPEGMALDAAGNLFIADRSNRRIRRVDGVTGIISTVAGNGIGGFRGDGGPALLARLSNPQQVALDANGNLFIGGGHRVRRVDAATGIISTVAGNGLLGFSGDGGPATSARFSNPRGIAVDSAGNLFIADSSNHRIRRVDASTGVIFTVAGNGTRGLNGDGGPATDASLGNPFDVALDAAGNLFIADNSNHSIRRVNASSGIIFTAAGNGIFGFDGDGGPATSARLASPRGVALDAAGHLYIADSGNDRIRRVLLSTQPPVALCQDVLVPAGEMTCAAEAFIDNGSFDPDGDPLTAVQNPPGPYGLGSLLVTLTVEDSLGATDTCQATVTVIDTIPPEISVSLEPTLLWPPNHRLMDIEATVTATDACGPLTVRLDTITSNEPDDVPGNGTSPGDIQGAILGSTDFEFALRAERDGEGNGRIYAVVYTATDGAGNQASTSSSVIVPHDQGGVVEPVILAVQDESNGTHLDWTPVPGAFFYNVISGQVSAIRDTGSSYDMGATTCIEAASADTSTLGYEDISLPLPGEAIFYLVEYVDGWNAGYGTDSAIQPRSFTGGCTSLGN